MKKPFNCAMHNIIQIRDRLWFWAFRENCLCSADEDLKKLRIELVEVNSLNAGPFNGYSSIVKYENKIVVLPEAGHNDIIIFDTLRGSAEYINFPENKERVGKLFCDGVVRGDELFLIPCQYGKILVFNFKTGNLDTIELQSKNKDGLGYAWGSIFVDGPDVYFSALNGNEIHILNMESKNVKNLKCKEFDSGSGVLGDGENLWIIPRKTDCIMRCDKNLEFVEKIVCFPQGYEGGEWSFSREKIIDDCIFLLPRTANMGLTVDLNQLRVEPVDFFREYSAVETVFSKFDPVSNVWKDTCGIRFIMSETGGIINEDSTIIYPELERSVPVIIGRERPIIESDSIGLEALLNNI